VWLGFLAVVVVVVASFVVVGDMALTCHCDVALVVGDVACVVGDVALACCWVVVSEREGGNLAAYLPGVPVTGGRWERRTGEGVVVVEKKAVTCHGWDAFPDLGEAGPWAAGVGYYYIMFLTW
jgi:hypothetical protein